MMKNNGRLKISIGIKSQFPSRINERNEIKKHFDELFIYIPNNQININNNSINTKVFLKDFTEIVQEIECPICLQFPLN